MSCAWGRTDEVPRLTLVALKDSESVTQRYRLVNTSSIVPTLRRGAPQSTSFSSEALRYGIHLMTSTTDDSVGNQGLNDTETTAHVGSGDGWSVLLLPAALPTRSPALAATHVTQLQCCWWLYSGAFHQELGCGKPQDGVRRPPSSSSSLELPGQGTVIARLQIPLTADGTSKWVNWTL